MKNLTAKITKYIFLAWLVISCINGPVIASAPNVFELSLDELANVIVTDTKIAQSHDSVTQKIEIIDSAEIDNHTALKRNLSDLLTYKSGLFINTLSRNDAN